MCICICKYVYESVKDVRAEFLEISPKKSPTYLAHFFFHVPFCIDIGGNFMNLFQVSFETPHVIE